MAKQKMASIKGMVVRAAISEGPRLLHASLRLSFASGACCLMTASRHERKVPEGVERKDYC